MLSHPELYLINKGIDNTKTALIIACPCTIQAEDKLPTKHYLLEQGVFTFPLDN